MRDFLIAAGIQFVSYLNLTVNFRAISHGQYLWAGATAMLAAALSYTLVRRIAQDESSLVVVSGMATGGALADMFGIYVTRVWG